MVEATEFLAELENAVSKGTAETRRRALWHATDRLITGSYSEEQIWAFGEIIGRLAQEIEVSARVRLANVLARSKNAPVEVVGTLARDDLIDVAGPILQHSERLDPNTLMSCARDKGQQHLLAISKRRTVPDAVTDILLERGSQAVVTSVARNSGAHFSESGFLQLLRRSEDDSILAECVGHRRDIPRQVFHQLISKASDEVKEKLKRERPDMQGHVQSIVTDVEGAIHARFGPASKDYFSAKRTVAKLHQQGDLTEDRVFQFAHSIKFNETVAALALLSSMPVDIVERALIDKNRQSTLILAKALKLSWTTTMSLLFLGAPSYRITAGELDRMKTGYGSLNAETCLRVLDAYRSRKQSAWQHASH
ncbi:DUF2336 domain-containing protein [Bradyrhizobium lablabi]|uniref:DUF2336 domain-containing protein n=1 Tax=Bradyrhizobium lablabi TaxID=722472 RepID=UPI001BA6E3CB|nr:DUF2336 domain-containing protein [Bradyrhizobium lablabi]MBR0692084.1 DUF2336 domain-containing protein [Bradyrhizobium lablabi]